MEYRTIYYSDVGVLSAINSPTHPSFMSCLVVCTPSRAALRLLAASCAPITVVFSARA